MKRNQFIIPQIIVLLIAGAMASATAGRVTTGEEMPGGAETPATAFVYGTKADSPLASKTAPNGPTGYSNVLVVARAGGDFTTIRAALNSIIDNSSTNRYLVWVAPGTYRERVTMKEWVDIEGAGEGLTKITSSGSALASTGTVVGASNAELRFLTVENVSGANAYSIAIYNYAASPSLLHVTATASDGADSYGLYNHNSSPRMTDVTATAFRGTSTHAVFNGSSSPSMTNVKAIASGGSANNIGVENYSSAPDMTNLTATASGGAGYTFGVYNYASSPRIATSTISASGTGNVYGVYALNGGTVTVDNSKVTSSTNTILTGGGTTTLVGASQLSGGPVYNIGTITCSASFDENYISPGLNVCP
jgi:pectin methylesterase-like acyl-CoA thioesterase